MCTISKNLHTAAYICLLSLYQNRVLHTRVLWPCTTQPINANVYLFCIPKPRTIYTAQNLKWTLSTLPATPCPWLWLFWLVFSLLEVLMLVLDTHYTLAKQLKSTCLPQISSITSLRQLIGVCRLVVCLYACGFPNMFYPCMLIFRQVLQIQFRF